MESSLPSFRKLLELAGRPIQITDVPAGSILGIDATKVMVDCVQIHENAWDLQTGGVGLAEKFLINFINDIQKHGIKAVFVFSGLSLPAQSDVRPSEKGKRSARFLAKKAREAKMQQEKKTTEAADMQQSFLSILNASGIPYLVAPFDAVAQLAFMNAIGFVDFVMSDNIHALPFGVNKMIIDYKYPHAILIDRENMTPLNAQTQSAPLLNIIRKFGFNSLPIFCALLNNDLGPKKSVQAFVYQWHKDTIDLKDMAKRVCAQKERETAFLRSHRIYKSEIIYDFVLNICRPLESAMKDRQTYANDKRVPECCGSFLCPQLMESYNLLAARHFVLSPPSSGQILDKDIAGHSHSLQLKKYEKMEISYMERHYACLGGNAVLKS